jgi:hypothetical protein
MRPVYFGQTRQSDGNLCARRSDAAGSAFSGPVFYGMLAILRRPFVFLTCSKTLTPETKKHSPNSNGTSYPTFCILHS